MVLKFAARASVAIPFVIAVGFVVAAIAMMLVERFGHVTAYWIMAAGLAAFGAIAAVVVKEREEEEEAAERKAEENDTRGVISDATTQAAVQAPIALLGALVTTPGGATTALKLARILGRNYPLVILLALIGTLMLPGPNANGASLEEGDQKPDGLMPSETRH